MSLDEALAIVVALANGYDLETEKAAYDRAQEIVQKTASAAIARFNARPEGGDVG